MIEFINKIKTLLKQKGINEEDTKCIAIEPLLRHLGWDTDNVSEVKREYPIGKNQTLGDYVLMINGNIKIVIEVKPANLQLFGDEDARNLNWDKITLKTNQVRRDIYNQIDKIFSTVQQSDVLRSNVKYIVLTTGDRFLIWDVTHHHGINQKPIHIDFDHDDIELICKNLNFLSKSNFL